MAFFTKTVQLSFESPTITASDAKIVKRLADTYILARLSKLAPVIRVLSYTYVSTASNVIVVRNKEYVGYDVTYTFHVDSGGTDVAGRAIEGAFDIPKKRKGEKYRLLARKAI